MTGPRAMFDPGALEARVTACTAHALASGALQPIRTEARAIEGGGVRFVVRMVSSLARKEAARERRVRAAGKAGRAGNPFLPYDEDLFVAEVSATHVCLLNKFNVLERHLLIVTRDFEDQETLLTAADFAALWSCMAGTGGLGFYNAGREAGASQAHKHLQLVPLPLGDRGPPVPVEALFAAAGAGTGLRRVPGLPFHHAFAWLASETGAEDLQALYRSMLDDVGIGAVTADGATRQSAPYNLLLTRRWMLLVPRARESVAGVAVNALGFAGSLFVRDREQLATIESRGPMAVLRAVAR